MKHYPIDEDMKGVRPDEDCVHSMDATDNLAGYKKAPLSSVTEGQTQTKNFPGGISR